MLITLLMLLAAAPNPAGDPPIAVPPDCSLTHFLADGRRIDRPPATGQARAAAPLSASAQAEFRGEDGGASSAYAWATSTGTSRAAASTHGQGRSITTTKDQRGCRIVVDDRAAGDHR